MLKIHFINVANGDAMLIEYFDGNNVWRMVLDAGRPEPEKVEGSHSCTLLEYLQSLSTSHYDALLVTHLHVDHFGGLTNMLPAGITFDHAYSTYFPSQPGKKACLENETNKTIIGLIGCMNYWTDDVQHLVEKDTILHELQETDNHLQLGDLDINMIVPNEMSAKIQKTIYEHIYANDPLPEDIKYWGAKIRNPGSLRVEIHYGGRRIILGGDCYGPVWERNEYPCDIFKVPHHADKLSTTSSLIEKLKPTYSVISWSANYNAKKDRPSRSVHEQLVAEGSKVFYTDSFASDYTVPQYHSAIIAQIDPDGTISWQETSI